MTASNFTTRFDLPLWEGSDDFSRLDFNAAHQSIEDNSVIAIVDSSGPGGYTASIYPKTFLYNSTTHILYFSNGVTWDSVAGAGLTFDATKLATGSVTTLKILDSNVTAGKIAADAVTTVKILDANVTAGKLASDSVITAKILDANVTDAKLASNAVTTAKILDSNVTANKLASDSVTTVKILNANVTAAKLASNAVTNAKVLDGEISRAKMAADMPLGIVAKTFLPVGSQSPISTETDIQIDATALAATFTAVAGKTYKVTAYLNVVTVGTTSADLRIKVGSTVYGRSITYVRPWASPATYGTTIRCETLITELSAGSKTVKATLQVTDGLATLAPTVTTLLDRSYIVVEDLGTL